MKEINKELLQNCAHRLMFDMTDEQYELLEKEFKIILKQMELIDANDVDELTPMTFPFDVTVTYLRDDDVIETIDTQEALMNAKDVVENQIRLPKVVL
jgi:aspartyl/glutamyl-tRNA(Asn/Gln) amidotransferase C subunit